MISLFTRLYDPSSGILNGMLTSIGVTVGYRTQVLPAHPILGR